MTVEQLLDNISSSEITEWQAFYKIHPFGPRMENWRAGLIAATIVNANRGKGSKVMKPEDFIPKSQVQRDQDMYELLKGMAKRGDNG